MPNFKFVFALVGFLAVLTSPCLAELTKISSECACDPERIDSFESPQKFAFGKFIGKCVNSCRFRNGYLIARKARQLELANVYQNQVYYRGYFKADQIEGAEVGFEEFSPGVYHVFLLFRFSELAPPISLQSQFKGDTRKTQTRSLVISSEGVPASQEPYSLIEGLLGNYLLSYRLTTGEESARWIASLKHSVHLYRLKLPKSAIQEMFISAIEKIQGNQFTERYQLFTKNCATNVMGLISKFDQKDISPLKEAISIAGPFGTLSSLRNRKLIEDEDLAPKKEYAPSASTDKHKRSYPVGQSAIM